MKTLLNTIPLSVNCQILKVRNLLFVFCLCFVSVGTSQPLAPIFEKGNTAYNDGDFEKAITYYQEVLTSGEHSAALYFNLGNAYYRLNNVAESIYYFEKAKQLDTKDPDIVFNSAFANNMTIDAIESIPESQLSLLHKNIFNAMQLDGWALLVVILAWLTLIFFLCYLFSNRSGIKRSFFSSFFISLLLLIGSFFFTFFSHQKEMNSEYAIIFSAQINIKSEPNERADVKFILHEGTKVALLDTLDEWQKIRIANGSEGWTKNASLRSLK